MIGWEIGDLAVCIETGTLLCLGDGYRISHEGTSLPPLGAALPVRVILPARDYTGAPCECGCLRLQFDNGLYGSARRFRKIRPDAHEGNIQDWRDLVEFFTKRVNA